MELIKPDLGLLIWMLLSFGIVVFVLTKFAWRPILTALKQRERSISKSLLAAQRAREEMVIRSVAVLLVVLLVVVI